MIILYTSYIINFMHAVVAANVYIAVCFNGVLNLTIQQIYYNNVSQMEERRPI